MDQIERFYTNVKLNVKNVMVLEPRKVLKLIDVGLAMEKDL